MRYGVILCMAAYAAVLPVNISFAGPGHDHGNGAFEKKSANCPLFSLTKQQIKNLKLETVAAETMDFSEILSVPMMLNAMDDGKTFAQGFLLEGSEILKVKSGQKVTFRLDALPDRTLHGTIARIDGMIDPLTRLYSVYARIETPIPENGQGLKGEMSVQIAPAVKAVGIPVQAVQGEFGDFYVFLKEETHFEKRAVVTGLKSGNWMEIREGIKPGDEIVTTGAYQLRYATGTPVTHDEDEDHND